MPQVGSVRSRTRTARSLRSVPPATPHDWRRYSDAEHATIFDGRMTILLAAWDGAAYADGDHHIKTTGVFPNAPSALPGRNATRAYGAFAAAGQSSRCGTRS